jgi:hypothetical protein
MAGILHEVTIAAPAEKVYRARAEMKYAYKESYDSGYSDLPDSGLIKVASY